MSNLIIGEIVTRFWDGQKFQFEYCGQDEWKQIKGSKMIPCSIKDELEKLARPKYLYYRRW